MSETAVPLAVYERRAGGRDDAVRELRLEPGRIGIGEILPLHGFPGDPRTQGREPPEDRGGEPDGGR